MSLVPRPDDDFARTMRLWDNRPDVEIWFPMNSASGAWEALVGEKLIQEKSMITFVNLVSAAIALRDEQAAREAASQRRSSGSQDS